LQKRALLFVSTNTFQLFFGEYFLALLASSLARMTKLTAESCGTKIQIVRADVSAVAKTLVFTVFVPGTVAGYVPWRLRQDAAPVSGAEEWAAITVIAIGIAIYLHTAFWGFALIGGGTPAPIAPTKILVVKGLHRFVRNPMYIGVALVIGGQAWLFHSRHIAIYMACMLLTAHLFVVFYEEPTLRKQFGEEYDRYRARVARWIPRIRS
jgi:protein-S-isoprenylcysteine O-methyltransferase Ste14